MVLILDTIEGALTKELLVRNKGPASEARTPLPGAAATPAGFRLKTGKLGYQLSKPPQADHQRA